MLGSALSALLIFVAGLANIEARAFESRRLRARVLDIQAQALMARASAEAIVAKPRPMRTPDPVRPEFGDRELLHATPPRRRQILSRPASVPIERAEPVRIAAPFRPAPTVAHAEVLARPRIEAEPGDRGIGDAIGESASIASSSEFSGVAPAPGLEPVAAAPTPTANPVEAARAPRVPAPTPILDTPGLTPPIEVPAEVAQIPVVWTDRVGFPVTEFVARYAKEHADAPALDEVLELEVVLGRNTSGYVAAGQGGEDVRFALSRIPANHPKVFHADALRSVHAQIAAEFNRRGLLGVLVAPDTQDINPEDVRDLRRPGDTALGLVVQLARVRELRSVGSGPRVDGDAKVNHELHARIREQSPVNAENGDLVRSDLLDDYLFRVNRHPGRRVDLSLARSEEPGGVAVDYLISESRPWTGFMQYANTASAATGGWRSHFGLVNHQLTDNDDILSLNYITTGFDELHSFSGSYDAPWGDSQHLRWKINGQLGSFEASDIGFADANFSSQTRQLGAGLSYNVFQKRELFVDLTGGLRWQQLETEHELLSQKGEGNFLLPHVGIAVERETPYSSLRASAQFEKGLSSNGLSEIGQLGRTFPDADWSLIRWDGQFSFYLEPLLARGLWSGVPRSSDLAHELSFGFRGQHAMSHRLVPQHQMVAGGFHSVRGFSEGAAAGDSVAIGQLQYNFHVPRLFGSSQQPMRIPLIGNLNASDLPGFRREDWDLRLHTFLDAARVTQTDRLSFERDRFLAGAGFGAELSLRRYLSLRLDYGMPLSGADDLADDGGSRLHGAITLRY